MKRICVFCGSSPGARRDYVQAAVSLGQKLAENEITLVYGGAIVGVMGKLAQATLDAGGHVIGVIPKGLMDMEVAFTNLPDLRVVNTMHERKALMAELSDGFIALPGGLGTLEELFEILTWANLGIHRKPCGLLNVSSYYDKLLGFLDYMVEEKFVNTAQRAMVLVAEHPGALIERFRDYVPPNADKAAWILKMTAELQ
ncbi:MAG: TIGR00730 family Rossman fold protein [Anaerolineae bacterium]|nr:TIGR00730 family Rossman fold protein [Anaerolineae bacterium]